MIAFKNEALNGLKNRCIALRLRLSKNPSSHPHAKAHSFSATANKNGFTLTEVMIAMTIMGLVMTSIFVLQGGTFRSIVSWARRLERFTAGTLFMTQTRIEKKTEPTVDQVKKLETPLTNMHYQMIEVPKESSLKDMQNMYLERVTIKWQEGKKKNEETIVMFHHRPEVKKR